MNTGRRNKDISGYLLLHVLAEIDGNFDSREAKVIEEYVKECFPMGGNLQTTQDMMEATSKEDYPLLFQKCAEDFYADSTEAERLHFIEFVLKLIKADHKVDQDENWFLNKLYQYWDI